MTKEPKSPRKERKPTRKDNDRIPRPRNAWIIYLSENSKKLPEGLAWKEICKILSHQWRSETEEVKTMYHRKADIEEQEHRRKYPYYSYHPQKKEQNEKHNANKALEAVDDSEKEGNDMYVYTKDLDNMNVSLSNKDNGTKNIGNSNNKSRKWTSRQAYELGQPGSSSSSSHTWYHYITPSVPNSYTSVGARSDSQHKPQNEIEEEEYMEDTSDEKY